MCDFCTQHGEGQKWYLNMKNYSRELWEQEGREEFAEHFLTQLEQDYGRPLEQFDAMSRRPVVGRVIRWMATRKQKATHWGQVIPIEDVEAILDMQDSITRMPCACRFMTTGQETRYCFGTGIDPTRILGKYPDYSEGLEVLGKEEAKKLIRSFDKQGMVHSVWTFKSPFIGGICNCDQDCMAYRVQVATGALQVMFRAEYVGLVQWDLCNGCKKCLLNCQFGAIRYSNLMKRPTIDAMRCYGCGVCRSVCEKDAINLKPRTEFANAPW